MKIWEKEVDGILSKAMRKDPYFGIILGYDEGLKEDSTEATKITFLDCTHKCFNRIIFSGPNAISFRKDTKVAIGYSQSMGGPMVLFIYMNGYSVSLYAVFPFLPLDFASVSIGRVTQKLGPLLLPHWNDDHLPIIPREYHFTLELLEELIRDHYVEPG